MKVTVNRPNRSTPRIFTSCDVARIAGALVVEGRYTEEEIIRCVYDEFRWDFFVVQKPRPRFSVLLDAIERFQEGTIIPNTSVTFNIAKLRDSGIEVTQEMEDLAQDGALALEVFQEIKELQPLVRLMLFLIRIFAIPILVFGAAAGVQGFPASRITVLIDGILDLIFKEYDVKRVRAGIATDLTDGDLSGEPVPRPGDCECRYLSDKRKRRKDEINNRKKTATKRTRSRSRQRTRSTKKK